MNFLHTDWLGYLTFTVPFKANLVCVMGKKHLTVIPDLHVNVIDFWLIICCPGWDCSFYSIFMGKKISTKYKVLPQRHCRKCMLIWRLNVSQALCVCSYVYVSLYSWMVLSSMREKKVHQVWHAFLWYYKCHLWARLVLSFLSPLFLLPFIWTPGHLWRHSSFLPLISKIIILPHLRQPLSFIHCFNGLFMWAHQGGEFYFWLCSKFIYQNPLWGFRSTGDFQWSRVTRDASWW